MPGISARFAWISASRRPMWMNWRMAMFLQKTGIVASMPFIPRTTPASITAIIRILVTAKVPMRVLPVG